MSYLTNIFTNAVISFWCCINLQKSVSYMKTVKWHLHLQIFIDILDYNRWCIVKISLKDLDNDHYLKLVIWKTTIGKPTLAIICVIHCFPVISKLRDSWHARASKTYSCLSNNALRWWNLIPSMIVPTFTLLILQKCLPYEWNDSRKSYEISIVIMSYYVPLLLDYVFYHILS